MSSGSPAVTSGAPSRAADQISSVTNGMIGCSRRSMAASTSAAAGPRPGAVRRRGVRAAQLDLGHLEEPVAVVAPGELVQLWRCSRRGRARRAAGWRARSRRPAASGSSARRATARRPAERLRPRAEDEAGGVPELVGEVARRPRASHGEALVAAGRGHRRPARSAGRRRRYSSMSRADRRRCPWSCSSSGRRSSRTMPCR